MQLTEIPLETTPNFRPHRLTPMLEPQSIALIGASRKRNSVGNDMLRNLLSSGYRGDIFPVNPSYSSLYGRACFPSIAQVPASVDLAIISVPNKVLERTVAEVITAGARSMVIFASAELEGDGKERIAVMAREAGIPVCGANCMGFFNPVHPLRAFSAFRPEPIEVGGVTYIAQSGSLLQALVFNDERLKFNLAVSTGQELVTTAADFMDYALELASTTTIALVLESVRDPRSFIATLEKANQRGVPVIALKLGRTEAGAKLALSHTGAIAGDADVYDALFRRYGVVTVHDLSELAATTILLSSPKRAAAGGLSAILDSGGERELVVDVASEVGVRFADINVTTTKVLANTLDAGLEPINPLDAWGTGREFEHVFETCLTSLLEDPDTALGMFVADLSDDLDLHAGYAEVCQAVAHRTNKPLVVMTNYSAWSHRRHAVRLSRAGIPVLDGTSASLRAVKHALDYRDFLEREDRDERRTENPKASYWRGLLSTRNSPLGEEEGYALLADYGINVPSHFVVESREAALKASQTIGFPLALKTATPGILHKSDVGGVKLDIADDAKLLAAYDDICMRLGPRALVCEMASGTVEMAFGLVQDRYFGTFVMVAFGGVWIEVLKDRQLGMAPINKDLARTLLANLRIAKVLGGVRGAPPCDVNSLVETYVKLSHLACDLGPYISEMDINPVMVSPLGVTAVDSLIIPKPVQ